MIVVCWEQTMMGLIDRYLNEIVLVSSATRELKLASVTIPH